MFVEWRTGCTRPCSPRTREPSFLLAHPEHPAPRSARALPRFPPPTRLQRSPPSPLAPDAAPARSGPFKSHRYPAPPANPEPLSSSVPTVRWRTTEPRREGGPDRAGLPPARAPPKPPFARILGIRTSHEGRAPSLASAPPPAARRPLPRARARVPGALIRGSAASATVFGPQSPDRGVPPGSRDGGARTPRRTAH